MKIKKIIEGVFVSNGIKFEKDVVVDVDDTFGKYLLATFKNMFEVVEQSKKEETKKQTSSIRSRRSTKKDS